MRFPAQKGRTRSSRAPVGTLYVVPCKEGKSGKHLPLQILRCTLNQLRQTPQDLAQMARKTGPKRYERPRPPRGHLAAAVAASIGRLANSAIFFGLQVTTVTGNQQPSAGFAGRNDSSSTQNTDAPCPSRGVSYTARSQLQRSRRRSQQGGT